jgi:hypothetical protein
MTTTTAPDVHGLPQVAANGRLLVIPMIDPLQVVDILLVIVIASHLLQPWIRQPHWQKRQSI